MDELAGIYSVRLQHALDSVYAVQRRMVRDDVADAALADGVAAVRAIDDVVPRRGRPAVRRATHGVAGRESEPVQRHRAEVAELLGRRGGPGDRRRARRHPAARLKLFGDPAAGGAARRRLVRRRDGADATVSCSTTTAGPRASGCRGLGPRSRPRAGTSSRCHTRDGASSMDDRVRMRVLVERFAEGQLPPARRRRPGRPGSGRRAAAGCPGAQRLRHRRHRRGPAA